MKWAMLAALLITFPAVAAIIYGVVTGNLFLAAAATASLAVNALPFLAAGFMIRASGDDDVIGH
jgi:hypothetical protein